MVNGGFVHTNNFSNFSLIAACIKQGSDLTTIFLAELGVFVIATRIYPPWSRTAGHAPQG